jgi:predicted nuclease with TOPRIM domain
VLNGVITKEAALSSSGRPNDLDLMLRKFLYAAEHKKADEGEVMAESLCDFSRIVELQEIKKLYDELQERNRQDLADRDAEIQRLRTEAEQRAQGSDSADGEAGVLRAENDRLSRQIQLVRQEYEAKVERLSARVRELSGNAPVPPNGEADRKGFFRR